jgi:hypothetical protein
MQQIVFYQAGVGSEGQLPIQKALAGMFPPSLTLYSHINLDD